MQYSADTVHGTVQFGRGRWGSGTSDDTCSLTQVAEQALFNVGLDPSTMAAHSAALDFFPEIYAAKDFQWENLAWQEYHRQHSALDLETAAEYDAAQLSKTPDSLIDPKLSEILSGSHASSACVDIQIDHPSAYTSHAGVAGPKSQPSPTISPEFLSVLHPYGQAQRGAHNLDDIEHSNSHHFPTDVFLPHGHASDLDVDGALSATTAPHMADMQPFVDFSNNSLGSPPLPEGDLLPTPEPSSPSSYASSASSFSPSNSWSRSPPTVSPPLRQRDSGRLKGKMTIIQPDEDEQAQKNALLLHYRNLGFSYKAIKSTLNLDDAESTLRGRYRTLTKPKSERLRRPTWSSRDVGDTCTHACCYIYSNAENRFSCCLRSLTRPILRSSGKRCRIRSLRAVAAISSDRARARRNTRILWPMGVLIRCLSLGAVYKSPKRYPIAAEVELAIGVLGERGALPTGKKKSVHAILSHAFP